MNHAEPEHLRTLLRSGYRYAYSLTHDAAAAEDLLHTAWLAMHSAGAEPSRAYLRRAIRSRFLDALPRARRELPVAELEAVDATSPAPLRFPAERARIDEALATLKPSQREALFLCVVEGHTRPRGVGSDGPPAGHHSELGAPGEDPATTPAPELELTLTDC